MRVPRWSLLAALLLSSLVTPTRVMRGQERHSHPPAATPAEAKALLRSLLTREGAPTLGVTIDGAKNPELIPDDLAYAHFIRATASSATPQAVQRREALLTRAGLTRDERQSYAQALGDVQARLDAVRVQLGAAAASATPDERAQLQRVENDIIADARESLRSGLGAAASARLDEHVQTHVKSRIRIYRGPMEHPPHQ
jgi:hypothetical protein